MRKTWRKAKGWPLAQQTEGAGREAECHLLWEEGVLAFILILLLAEEQPSQNLALLPGFRQEGCLDGCHVPGGVSVKGESLDTKAMGKTRGRVGGLCVISSTFVVP